MKKTSTNKILFALLLATTSVRGYAFQLALTNQNPNSAEINFDELNFRKQFQLANDLFEVNFGMNNQMINVVIDSKECFRTGYNFLKKQIQFCQSDKVINAGLNSPDVIHHELFHAFLCATYEKYCDEKTIRADIHEGLADYFAYHLDNNNVFGDGFYENYPYVRAYRVKWHWDLVETAHQAGNVLVSELIQTKTSLAESLKHFDRPLSSGVRVQARENGVQLPESRLNRYRIKPNQALTIELLLPPELVKRVVFHWDNQDYLSINMIDLGTFVVSSNGLFKAVKIEALYLNDDGEEIGRKAFYFQSAK